MLRGRTARPRRHRSEARPARRLLHATARVGLARQWSEPCRCPRAGLNFTTTSSAVFNCFPQLLPPSRDAADAASGLRESDFIAVDDGRVADRSRGAVGCGDGLKKNRHLCFTRFARQSLTSTATRAVETKRRKSMKPIRLTDDAGNQFWLKIPSGTWKMVHSFSGSAPVAGLAEALQTRCGKLLRSTGIKGEYVVVLTGVVLRSQDPDAP